MLLRVESVDVGYDLRWKGKKRGSLPRVLVLGRVRDVVAVRRVQVVGEGYHGIVRVGVSHESFLRHGLNQRQGSFELDLSLGDNVSHEMRGVTEFVVNQPIHSLGLYPQNCVAVLDNRSNG